MEIPAGCKPGTYTLTIMAQGEGETSLVAEAGEAGTTLDGVATDAAISLRAVYTTKRPLYQGIFCGGLLMLLSAMPAGRSKQHG